jgi:hypothetical protein
LGFATSDKGDLRDHAVGRRLEIGADGVGRLTTR